MGKVRRSQYAFFRLEDDYLLDLGTLLRGGDLVPATRARIAGLSGLTGERHTIEPEDLDLLRLIPADRWIDDSELDCERLGVLTEKGFLLREDGDATQRRLRERDDALSASEWNPVAALYHYMTQWSGVDIRGDGESLLSTEEAVTAGEAFVAEHGLPPAEFAEDRGAPAIRLPARERDGALYRTLIARRTTRAFDTEAPMSLEQLDTVLRYVFGCMGYATTAGGVLLIKRTSPSGGGLHPIEAYPIINNVAGIAPGIYHYSPRDHSLALLSDLEADECRLLSTSFMCGQSYFGDAHVSFVLTARFFRNHWKYRSHQKAYTGILMDVAHLSQTLYLVSEDVGLGAFITIAINGRDVEERLGLDGVEEGVIAMVGCGPRLQSRSPLELDVTPVPPA